MANAGTHPRVRPPGDIGDRARKRRAAAVEREALKRLLPVGPDAGDDLRSWAPQVSVGPFSFPERWFVARRRRFAVADQGDVKLLLQLLVFRQVRTWSSPWNPALLQGLAALAGTGRHLVVAGLFSWVSGPALKVVEEYLESVKKYPNPPAPNITKF